MKTAEEAINDEQTTSGRDKAMDAIYTAVGLAALAKEKAKEWADELVARNPEMRERGEKIVNAFVDEAKEAAGKFKTDFNDRFHDAVEFVKDKAAQAKDRMHKDHTADEEAVEHTDDFEGSRGAEQPQAESFEEQHESIKNGPFVDPKHQHPHDDVKHHQNPNATNPKSHGSGPHTQHK